MTRTLLALLFFGIALTAFGCGGSNEEEFRAHDEIHAPADAEADDAQTDAEADD